MDVDPNKKYRDLEERLKEIEGNNAYDINDFDMCLVPAMLLKFKTPKFEKYKGPSSRRNHLMMFCRKIDS